ncbi:MAG: GAF domain-containing protein, partial [Syntrophales bacterium]
MAEKQSYFRTIRKISEAFGTTKDMDVLLQLIVDSAVAITKAKAACLFLADEEKEKYKAVAQRGLSEQYLHAGYGHAERIAPILLKDGFIYYRDATTDPRLENRDKKKAEGIGSILVLPAKVKGELIGVLTMYTSKIREFDKEEIEFLRVLAEQGGLAIENARLVEKLRSNTRLFLN